MNNKGRVCNILGMYSGLVGYANLETLLLGNTHSAAMATSGLGVLTTDGQTPRVTETTMDAGLDQTLVILTKLVIQVVGKELAELTILNVLLTIEEPVGDLVLARVLHDGDNTLKISLIEFTGTKMKAGLASINQNYEIHTAWRCRPQPCGKRGWRNDDHNHG